MRSNSATLKSTPGAPEIQFTIRVWKENGTYVGFSPELDVSSCGDSVRQAKSRLKEAVNLFLEDAALRGTLTDILIEAGFEWRRGVYRPRALVARAKVKLALPIAS
jgi:predicted RNase H-like HicB family nuclease